MTHSLKHIGMSLLLAGVALCATYALTLLSPSSPFSQPAEAAVSGDRLIGQAWSDNIGWICFGDATFCPNAGNITVDASGNVSGYAWSENIGWIQFGGTSYPASCNGCSGTTASSAKFTGNALVGWAKAVTSGDGWDGWIALSGTGYGPTHSGTDFSGYAWGSDVVGWIDFDLVSLAILDYCSDISGNQSGYLGGACLNPNPPPGNCLPPGYTYSGGACIPPAATLGTLTANPSRVRSGGSTTLSWTGTNLPASCTLSRNPGAGGFPATVASSPTSGSAGSGTITQNTVFTLTCGSATLQAMVGTLPAFQEI